MRSAPLCSASLFREKENDRLRTIHPSPPLWRCGGRQRSRSEGRRGLGQAVYVPASNPDLRRMGTFFLRCRSAAQNQRTPHSYIGLSAPHPKAVGDGLGTAGALIRSIGGWLAVQWFIVPFTTVRCVIAAAGCNSFPGSACSEAIYSFGHTYVKCRKSRFSIPTFPSCRRSTEYPPGAWP